ncbi:MAG: NUDIX hydrolase [Myxococcales bacterium]|nr:NUDIX hydrolase [Myxococcales bacterium]
MPGIASFKRILYDGFARLEAWKVPELSFEHLVLRSTDSVACVLVDKVANRVLLVRQQRPAIIRADNPLGVITELVAGRLDVDLGPKALAVKEAWEEAGVTLREDDIKLLNGGQPVALSGGILTERSYLAVAYISPEHLSGEDHDRFGREDEGEHIERRWMSLADFIADTTSHEDIRVWGAAQYLRAVHYENRLKATQ